MSGMEAIIRLSGVSKSYVSSDQRVEILNDVSFEMEAGHAVSIQGVSGCGKSTLLNLIGAIDRPNNGEIMACGQRLDNASPGELVAFRRDKVGFIFQFYNLFPTLNALENVLLGLESAKGLSASQARGRAMEYLEAVGLADKARKFPEQLSGGEQQRVAIARALAKEPPLILADEPTGSLDEKTGEMILQLLNKLQRERQLSFIIVTHNPEISQFATRSCRLHNGALVDIGS